MKCFFNSILLGLLSLFFFSCDEGEKFEYTYEHVKKTLVQREFLMSTKADTIVEYVLNPVSLYNALGKDTADKVVKAELLSCSMSIRGLKDKNPDLTLNNFTLLLNESDRYIFGNCVNEPQGLYDFASDQAFTNNILESFSEKVLYYYDHSNRNPKLSAVFIPNKIINYPDSVFLTLSIEATYTFIKMK
ncbi:hypothetical protein LJB98_03580 [Bacteroidales bacterium OttesenSCG-928-M11]|nr:hypothetical protein [Bacteroidales bacterium OttesenSCG-928-M11]